MFRAFLPALSISITSLLCPNLKNSGSNVPFRPPGWVFGIVWPILYVTTGYAWHLSKQDDLFTLVIGLCCAWLVVYSCKRLKYEAAFVLMASAITSWYVVHKLGRSTAMYYTLPLAIWLTFASSINAYEITHS
ncbi:MAG: hypothetical protein CME10_14840 [Gemmatimonadetes bacterium]|nr:hypothetical protein [Gemmatimonadota bacterium]